MSYRYIFGPVHSGRLGASLGLDLLGAPICSLDCVYCECGPTKKLTCERREWVAPAKLLDELVRFLKEDNAHLDYITLGGMGEPCLNAGLAEIITESRRISPDVPVAVLTNSTLLTDPEARKDLALADVVLPSMDSLVKSEFKAINRPDASLDLHAVANGLLAFRDEFEGRMFLEVLLADGYNASEENLALLREYVHRLRPDRTDIVTMTRPGAYAEAKPVDSDTITRFRDALSGEHIYEEAVAHRKKYSDEALTPDQLRTILQNSLKRRPQTTAQLAAIFGIDIETALVGLHDLAQLGIIEEKDGFWMPVGRFE